MPTTPGSTESDTGTTGHLVHPRLLGSLAVIGTGFVIFQLWGYVAWALDGGSEQFTTNAALPDNVANAVLLGRIITPLFAVGWIAFVIRGVRRERVLTWPALLTCVWILTYWQESLANITGARFAYNAELFDLGDWTGHMPFLNISGPGLAQPLGMETFVFIGAFPLFSWGAAALMRNLKARTGWATWLVVAIAFAVVLVAEFALEMRSLSQEVHSYPEVFGALSIHDGHPNQFPLYENWLLGLMWFLPGFVIFLIRDRRGRNVPPLGRSGAFGTLTVVLAGAGALNLAFLAYNLIAFVWLPADTVAPMPPWLDV